MKRTLGVLALIMATNTACLAQVAKKEGLKTETINHDGHERTYYVYLPKDHDKTKKAPLVLALHGGGGRAALFNRSTNGTFSAAADKHGAVVVYPQGLERAWNDGRKKHLEVDSKNATDDLGFLSKLIDRMHERYNTDPERVYATGISNGGFMSIRLALDLSDKIAAAAPVTAQIPKVLADKTPKHPVSIMIINGTADPLVPYKGGEIRLFKRGRSRGTILSTDETIARFRKTSGCKETATIEKLPDRDPDDGARVTIETYTGGRKGAEVVLVRVEGGGHTWPGGKQYLGKRLIGTVCRDFDASEKIFAFFLRHKLQTPSKKSGPH